VGRGSALTSRPSFNATYEIVGIEVKAGATVTDADFTGLRALRDAAGDNFVRGFVAYLGSGPSRSAKTSTPFLSSTCGRRRDQTNDHQAEPRAAGA
jgi:hypothetical protein